MAEWTDEELKASLEAYDWMRNEEEHRRSFSKTKLYERLTAEHGRTAGAWEYRMQNISAVMSDMGRPLVSGLLPAENMGAGVKSRLERLILARPSSTAPSDWDAVLRQLRPHERQKIIDVVASAGIDISDWSSSTTGDANTNPKYCFNWVFGGSGQPTLACLWYETFQSDATGIFVSYSLRPVIELLRQSTRGKPRARRADALDTELQKAFFSSSPIRVAIVEGKITDVDDEKKSSAKKRMLDSENWFVTHVDHADGTFVIRRGISTQHSSTPFVVQEQPIPPGTGATHIDQDSPIESTLAEDLLNLHQQALDSTTRQRLIDARLGQGSFRADLMHAWGGACSATNCRIAEILRASHIKPWRKSDDSQRLDVDNGLLLTANLDALFDKGLIGFGDDGRIWVSHKLDHTDLASLNLPEGLRHPPSPKQRVYLQWHRTYFTGC